ncbi:hypothetical protein CYMTET_20304 [Cymbomonas tetramitiformis]|uniref:Uncharacterized protein n=1 Tax=Cymbomonas tetramitiformis TaxID=36881 RepID=A0AAE0L4C7_9CHLO|nr:hypothetical protein CYMTET_20304 [Cymbomonas tetramitiformis]
MEDFRECNDTKRKREVDIESPRKRSRLARLFRRRRSAVQSDPVAEIELVKTAFKQTAAHEFDEFSPQAVSCEASRVHQSPVQTAVPDTLAVPLGDANTSMLTPSNRIVTLVSNALNVAEHDIMCAAGLADSDDEDTYTEEMQGGIQDVAVEQKQKQLMFSTSTRIPHVFSPETDTPQHTPAPAQTIHCIETHAQLGTPCPETTSESLDSATAVTEESSLQKVVAAVNRNPETNEELTVDNNDGELPRSAQPPGCSTDIPISSTPQQQQPHELARRMKILRAQQRAHRLSHSISSELPTSVRRDTSSCPTTPGIRLSPTSFVSLPVSPSARCQKLGAAASCVLDENGDCVEAAHPSRREDLELVTKLQRQHSRNTGSEDRLDLSLDPRSCAASDDYFRRTRLAEAVTRQTSKEGIKEDPEFELKLKRRRSGVGLPLVNVEVDISANRLVFSHRIEALQLSTLQKPAPQIPSLGPSAFHNFPTGMNLGVLPSQEHKQIDPNELDGVSEELGGKLRRRRSGVGLAIGAVQEPKTSNVDELQGAGEELGGKLRRRRSGMGLPSLIVKVCARA